MKLMAHHQPGTPLQRVAERARSARSHAADLELAERALHGDQDAVDRLVERLAALASMIRARHRRMGAPLSEEELADVVQDALVAIWRKLATYEGRASLETWAYRFGATELVKTTHKRYRDHHVDTDDDELVTLAGAPPASELPIEPSFLHKSLARLDPAQARVVRAHVFDQHSFPEIARNLRIPLGTAKGHYYRGLDRLRDILSLRMAR